MIDSDNDWWQIVDDLCSSEMVTPIDDKLYDLCLKKSKIEALELARKQVANLLSRTFTCPLGQNIYFSAGNTEDLWSYTLHLIAGKDKSLEKIRLARVLGIFLASQTLVTPSIIVLQSNGRKAYTKTYLASKWRLLHTLIVGVEPGQINRVITSVVTMDKPKDKRAVRRELYKQLERAETLLYEETLKAHRDGAL